MKTTRWSGLALCAILVAVLVWNFVPPVQQAEAQVGVPFYSYSAKFVCGWNRTNIGTYTTPTGANLNVGEATVKLGNYATEINILNPQLFTLLIDKKVIVLYRSDAVPPHIGREPKVQGPTGFESVGLPPMWATLDDCNKLYELAGIPIVNPPVLAIGYLLIQSPRELDVTAVYTAELCSDQRLAGGAVNLCNVAAGQNYGVSLSIDVEQVDAKFIQ